MLLCSDGLTNMLDDKEIKIILESEQTLEKKCEQLIDQANLAGGTDNITALLIQIDKGGGEP